MFFLFLLIIIAAAFLMVISYKKYEEHVQPVDKKEYPLKALLPMGLFLIDSSGYEFNTAYDLKITAKIGELTGHRFVQYYTRVHLANKIALIILEITFMMLFANFINIDIYYFLTLAFLMIASFLLLDKELDTKIIKRKTSLKLDFPDFLNTLILLVNSGMNITRAWEKAANEGRSTRLLYLELQLVLTDIRGGKNEVQAYEDFAKRCRVPEITKFVAVIIQNLRKGNSELVSVLRLISNECWEMRKNTAKRLGEEASTKLLLPMMITFVAILIIVIIPAIMSMQGMI